MKLRFRARVNISRATFRPEALNSTSIGGFFVHRDFENVEQYQQEPSVEEARRRIAPPPPKPIQKRPKERELDTGRGGSDEQEKGEGGSGVGGKDKGKVEQKKIGKEGEKKKKGEGKKIRKGPKGAEGAIKKEERKGEVKNGENGAVMMGKEERKKKAKVHDTGKEMIKEGEVEGQRGKVSAERDEMVDMSVGRMGASGEELSEAANPMFARVGDKKGKESSKSANAKSQPKSTEKDKGEILEAGNPLFAMMGNKTRKDNKKGTVAIPPAKSTKDKEFSEAGNPVFATMSDKKGKENSKGAVAKISSKQAKKDEGKRMFMKKKKDVETPPNVEVVAPKHRKLPPVDMNAPSARNPLLQYKERSNSGQLQVKTSLQASNDEDSGDEFDA